MLILLPYVINFIGDTTSEYKAIFLFINTY